MAMIMARMPPVARAAVTSGVVMSVGDLVCQKVQARNKPGTLPIDWGRTARFGIIGATLHGPFFLYGFGALDKICGRSASLGTAIKKTALGQVTLFPTYLAAFFMYMGALEGRGLQGGIDKIKTSYASTYASGTIFWPIVNTLNFRFVPPTQRILYINGCGLMWNAFLSWVNSRL